MAGRDADAGRLVQDCELSEKVQEEGGVFQVDKSKPEQHQRQSSNLQLKGTVGTRVTRLFLHFAH